LWNGDSYGWLENESEVDDVTTMDFGRAPERYTEGEEEEVAEALVPTVNGEGNCEKSPASFPSSLAARSDEDEEWHPPNSSSSPMTEYKDFCKSADVGAECVE